MEDAHISAIEDRGQSDKDLLIEELREAVRARDEFVAIAAHELRNPMTPILMQVSSLLAAARDPRRCRPELIAPRMENLQLAVSEFVRRSTTLLDISRITAGNQQVELAKVELSQLVCRVVDRSAIAARMARSRLQTDLQPDIIGRWDPLALEQVTENLLSNALKFGAGRPVHVALRSDGQTASLTVRDQGAGIAEEDRLRIFQRFEQAVTRREHGGFGVGLWLANQLIKAMNGSIEIESVPGEGTTFTVVLPVAGPEQNASPNL